MFVGTVHLISFNKIFPPQKIPTAPLQYFNWVSNFIGLVKHWRHNETLEKNSSNMGTVCDVAEITNSGILLHRRSDSSNKWYSRFLSLLPRFSFPFLMLPHGSRSLHCLCRFLSIRLSAILCVSPYTRCVIAYVSPFNNASYSWISKISYCISQRDYLIDNVLFFGFQYFSFSFILLLSFFPFWIS